MSTYADMAQAKRAEAIGNLQHLLRTVADEGRDLTAEESEQADRMEADVQRYGSEAQRALRAQALVAAADEWRAELAPTIEPAREERREPTELDLIRRGFEAFRNGQTFVYDMARDGLAMAKPKVNETFYRALQSAGSSAIPTAFSEAVIVYQRTATPMLDPGIVTILETPDGRPIVLPRLTADVAHGGTVTAEAAGINELDPTISSVTLNAFKYGVTNLWSAELDQDNVINLEDLLARSTGRELGLDIGTHLTTGTGTVQPNGIVNAATAGSTATGGTAVGSSFDTFFAPADLIDLWYSLAAPYRNSPSSGWMVATTAAQKMRKFRDANAQFLWEGSLSAGVPDRFNGRPVYENPAMTAVASATKSVIAGDLSAYYVRRTPIRVEFSRDYKFNTDQLALRVIYRVDGNLPDAVAIKSMVSANT